MRRLLRFLPYVLLLTAVFRLRRLAPLPPAPPSPAPILLSAPPPPLSAPLSRIFPPWPPSRPFPCRADAERNEKFRLGIQFVKIPKCASSTSAGLAIRIARRKGNCNVAFMHSPAHIRNYEKRDREGSFLWSVVRDPASRRLSAFFHFEIGRKPKYGNATRAEVEELLRRTLAEEVVEEPGGAMSLYLAATRADKHEIAAVAREPSDAAREAGFAASVRRILDAYDFLGTVERLDESLVALRLLLGLDAGDVAYLSSKSSGGFDAQCTRIPENFIDRDRRGDFFDDAWRRRNQMDYLLYAAADRSLDATIAGLGAERVREALEEHRALQARVEELCGGKARYPCTKTGKPQRSNCYWNDIGCGHACINTVVEEWEKAKKS